MSLVALGSAFQLHHTGIKTNDYSNLISGDYVFQLHHTGIKT